MCKRNHFKFHMKTKWEGNPQKVFYAFLIKIYEPLKATPNQLISAITCHWFVNPLQALPVRVTVNDSSLPLCRSALSDDTKTRIGCTTITVCNGVHTRRTPTNYNYLSLLLLLLLAASPPDYIFLSGCV